MSDPKPLRFTRVEAEEQVPDWVKVAQSRSETAVRPLELSQVAVDFIQDAADGSSAPQRAATRSSAGARVPTGAGQRGQTPTGGAQRDAGDLRSLPPGPTKGQVVGRKAEPAFDPTLEDQLREATAHFGQACMDLALARNEALSEVEGQLLDLAVRIAEVIVEHEVQSHPELHQRLVGAALDCIAGEREVQLHVSEATYAVLNEIHGGAQFERAGVTVRMLKKPGLPGLGCVVESGHVRVDGRVTQRLQAMRRAFEEERRRLAEGDGTGEGE